MKTLMSVIVALALAGPFARTLYAQDVTGDWQGTLTVGKELRLIVRIARQLDKSLQVRIVSVDQNPADWGAGNTANTASLEGNAFKFTVDGLKASYEGTLSADGNSIAGTFSQGASLPLDLARATKETAWRDPVAHADQFITVDKDVRLEVLDFGGSGPPLVLLAGLGNTAHIFDRFAPKLTDQFHVYAITRRGFGASSMPASGYAADRLGDDVLDVIDALKLNRPLLAGHSVAGEELSSIGSRRPEKVAGLVYLDAAYSYAIHDPACSTPRIPPPSDNPRNVGAAIQAGTQKYTDIKTAALALVAAPKEGSEPTNDNERGREGCATTFERLVRSSRVVRLPGATHYVFISAEAEVLKQIRDFAGTLAKKQ